MLRKILILLILCLFLNADSDKQIKIECIPKGLTERQIKAQNLTIKLIINKYEITGTTYIVSTKNLKWKFVKYKKEKVLNYIHNFSF